MKVAAIKAFSDGRPLLRLTAESKRDSKKLASLYQKFEDLSRGGNNPCGSTWSGDDCMGLCITVKIN